MGGGRARHKAPARGPGRRGGAVGRGEGRGEVRRRGGAGGARGAGARAWSSLSGASTQREGGGVRGGLARPRSCRRARPCSSHRSSRARPRPRVSSAPARAAAGVSKDEDGCDADQPWHRSAMAPLAGLGEPAASASSGPRSAARSRDGARGSDEAPPLVWHLRGVDGRNFQLLRVHRRGD